MLIEDTPDNTIVLACLNESKVVKQCEQPKNFEELERCVRSLFKIQDKALNIKFGNDKNITIMDNASYLKALACSEKPIKFFFSGSNAVTNSSAKFYDVPKIISDPYPLPKESAELKNKISLSSQYSHSKASSNENIGMELFGSYDPICFLGKGAYGQVWLLRNPKTGELIAEKRIPLRHGMEMIEREIKMMEKLYHPHVANLKLPYEDKHKDDYVLITDFLPCGSFDNKIEHQKNKNKPFPEYKIRRWAVQIISAFYYLMDRSIVHRDIKPANFIMNEEGDVKLIDFGIAQKVAAKAFLTYSGTKEYQAPEAIIEGFPDTGIETCKLDIWGLGCFLFELCTHTFAHLYNKVEISVETIRKIIEKNFGSSKPLYSDQLLELICQMLKLNQKERISVEQLVETDYFRSRYLHDVLCKYRKDNPKGADQAPEFSVNIGGKQVFKVRQTTLVKELKVMINKDLNYMRAILRYKGVPLENYKRLGECNINKNSTLEYTVVPLKPLTVQVTLLDGEKIIISVPQNASVMDAKEIIRATAGIAVENQHLFYTKTKKTTKETVDKYLPDNDLFPNVEAVVLKEEYLLRAIEFKVEEKKMMLGEEKKKKAFKEEDKKKVSKDRPCWKIPTKGNTRVDEIKSKIIKDWKIHAPKINLYFKGVALKNEMTMEELGITHGAAIVVIF